MARKPPSRKAEQAEMDEFAERYETLASIYKDPIEVVFEVMSGSDTPPETKLQAAGLLMSFRFPKLKALEVKNDNNTKPVQFTINLTTPAPAQPELDVTPAKLTLVGPR